jgi:hypothetical protein
MGWDGKDLRREGNHLRIGKQRRAIQQRIILQRSKKGKVRKK